MPDLITQLHSAADSLDDNPAAELFRQLANDMAKQQKPARKRSQAQQETFGSLNPNREGSPELGREIARIRRDYGQIEDSWKRVVSG